MKKFILENWFKLSIAIAILLVGISVCYYIVIYIPKQAELKQQQQTKEDLDKKQTDCQKLCDKRAQEDKDYWRGGEVFDPYCKYDQTTDICYFSGGASQD